MAPIPGSHGPLAGDVSVYENAFYEFTIEAWGDSFRSWQHEFQAKFEAQLTDLQSETLEGARLVEGAAGRAPKADAHRLLDFAAQIRAAAPGEVYALCTITNSKR